MYNTYDAFTLIGGQYVTLSDAFTLIDKNKNKNHLLATSKSLPITIKHLYNDTYMAQNNEDI